ncbi:MAG: DnaJ domain-containing protein [Cyanobacteria bacterium P01_A01_bin.17]
MSFEITRGIAAYDCPDHYAVLGVALDASASEIRKRYLKIARSLHPDARGQGADVAQASQLLSKLVNPAYETLSQDKEREEYRLLVRLVSQRVTMEQNQQMHTAKAKELLKASDVGVLYKEMVAELAEGQYQALDHVQAVVEQLSELNLAYLIRQESVASAPPQKFATSQTVQTSAPEPVPQPPPSSPKTAVTSPQAAPAPSKPPVDSFVSQYVRRAEELIAKNRFQQAIQELRDGLKLDPKNSQCQSLLGSIYLKQKQTKMAKIHFRQALKLEPGDIDALKGMEKIAKLEKAAQGASSQSAQQASGRKGLFGLFGGKK